MLHFIPAWYQQGKWCENEQYWRVRRMYTEFDDTVKQVQLFHRSRAYPYQILLLGFSPNFRHFLHRQGVYRAPYWSCFDAIQEVRRKKAVVLSFHNMKWPPHTEFQYTPFVVVALQKGEKYAQVEFGEDGNPIEISIYRGGKVYRRNIYDDRGFISSTIVYEDEKPLFQDYLMENGTWKLRCYEQDGHVEVNPKASSYLLAGAGFETLLPFSRACYDSIDQVISEVFASYLELTDRRDIFCAAMDNHHAGLLGQVLKGRNIILSFFGDRYHWDNKLNHREMIGQAAYIVTDSRENSENLKKQSGIPLSNITDIPPYDTRTDFGISRQLNVQKILVPADGLKKETFGRLIRCLESYVLVNPNARIHLFTRNGSPARQSQLLEQARAYLETEEPDRMLSKFFRVEQCVDELSVSRCMREQKIIVDMGDIPELYLQIMALSTGIPQIVCTQTQFVEHGKNGMVLQDMGGLKEMLDYYLDGLSNWNDAMIASYEIGKRYTAQVLIERWKEVIDRIG